MPDGSECMCGVCLTSGPDAEVGIARSKARPPTEPETRLAAIKACLADREDPVPACYVPALELAVARLEAVIDAGITPTKYVPDAKLKGGKGR